MSNEVRTNVLRVYKNLLKLSNKMSEPQKSQIKRQIKDEFQKNKQTQDSNA